MVQMIYLQSRNKVTDVKNTLMVTKGWKEGRDELGDWDRHVNSTDVMHK